MRKISLLLICALCALAVSAKGKKAKVVKQPAVAALINGSTAPVAVTLADTATVLHFVKPFFWSWGIMGEAALVCDGKEYKVRSGKCFKRKTVVPDWTQYIIKDEKNDRISIDPKAVSNEVVSAMPIVFNQLMPTVDLKDRSAVQDSMVLVFEPLPKNAKTFDFIEEKVNDCWQAYGIRLDGKQYAPSTFTPEPAAPATFGPYDGKMQRSRIFIKLLGDLSEEALNSIDFSLHTFGSYTQCYPFYRIVADSTAAPDSHTKVITLDACYPFNANIRSGLTNFEIFVEPGKDLTIAIDVPALTRSLNGDASADFIRFCSPYAALCEDYFSGKYFGKMTRQMPVPRNAKTAAPMTFPVYRDSCRAALSRDLADAKALTDVDAGTRRYLMLYAEGCYVAKLTGYRRWLHQFLYAQGEISGEKRDSLFKAHYGKDFTLKEEDVATTLNLFRSPEAVAVLTDARSTDVYARANGLEQSPLGKWCTEIKRVIDVKERIGKMQAVSDAEIAALPEAMQTFARADNEKLKATLKRLAEEAADRIKPTPEVTDGRMLDAIAANYKGKVAVVDYWATWCGPCRQGIKAMKPLKAEFEGKDVVFVYVTDFSSPADAWSESVPEIRGDHYRFDAELWETPEVQSIPRYFVFDKNGAMQLDETGFTPELIGKLRELIGKLLEQ